MEPKHPAADCESCPLNVKGKFVPSTFPTYSVDSVSNYGKNIVLVGESPGRTEVRKGAPFLGPSGDVMNAVLKEQGLDRRQMLVSNAIACHYDEKDFAKPPPEAVIACRPRLLEEMKQCNIDTAITVGAVAATSLLKTKVGITKLRAGAPRLSEYCLDAGGGVDVIPTFHPAFALRDQSKFPYIVRDVAKVKPGGVWGKWKDPDYIVVEHPAVARKYINWMIQPKYGTGPIVVDTESGADKDDTFGGGINEVLCVGVWWGYAKQVLVFTPTALDKFNRMLLGELFMRRGIVAQNCFVGETEYITKNGVVSLKQTVGQTVEVCTKNGWEKGQVNYYGKSNDVYDIVFAPYGRSRSSLAWQVSATGNHRWEIEDYVRRSEIRRVPGEIITTNQLQKGDRVYAVHSNIIPDLASEAFIHGLIFGDGNITTWQPKNSDLIAFSIRLCGEKQRFEYLFPRRTYPPSANGEPICIHQSVVNMKELPSPNVNAQYIADFIEGWQLMDGTKSSGSGTRAKLYNKVVQSIDKNAIEWLVENAAAGGWICTGSNEWYHTDSYKDHMLYSVTISKDPKMSWVVRSVTPTNKVHDVYCVEVPTTERFTLHSGIYTANSKYDVSRCLNRYLSVDPDSVLDIPVVHDTMLMSYTLDEGKGVHSLEYMSAEYLGTPDYKKWIDESINRTKARMRAEAKAAKKPLKGLFSTGKDFSLVEPPVLHKYNAFDTYSTKLLCDKFGADVVLGNVGRIYKWLMKVSHMLVHVEQTGLYVDLDYNAQLEIEYKDMLNDITFVGTESSFNPNSPQQVKRYLERVGIRVDSTNKITLKGLVERYSILGRDDVAEFCQSLLDHRGASKQMGTYITGLRKLLIEGVAHPSFLLHSTTTGRTSSRAPNLQNIPRGSEMRRQFIPSSTNRIFVQADYSNAEFRVMTWLGKDETTREIFNDPTRKIFIELSRRMYGREVFDNLDARPKKEAYTLIKTFAYGIAYGREAKAIALAFGIPVVEAKRQMKQFTDMIPGIIQYQKWIKKQVFDGHDLVNPFGRRRRFHLITNANVVTVMNEALSFMPQSTSSDICLEAACQLDSAGYEIRNLVHDSILIECDRRDVLEVSTAMRDVMVGTAERVTEGYVRFDVDIEVGHSWGDLVELDNYLVSA